MFRAAAITRKGFEVLQEAMAGHLLTFTRMEYGDGIVSGLSDIVADSETLEKYEAAIAVNPAMTEEEKLQLLRTNATDEATKNLFSDVTELVSKCGDIGMYNIVTEESLTKLTGKIIDSSISKDFRARELGVFAKVDDGEEVLFAYFSAVDYLSGNINDSSDFISIPALLGQEQVVIVNVATGSASNITMQYNVNIYATKKEFDEAVAKIRITISEEVAKIIASAPEDFDTLKEISDWLNEHESSAASMNSQIQINQNDIASIKTKLGSITESGDASMFLMMFNMCRPVGDTYVQYPQCKSPMDLWGTFSTWKVVDYGGAFFRAEGGNANAFIEESGNLIKQAGQNASHSHSIQLTTTYSGTHEHSLIVNSSGKDNRANSSVAFQTTGSYQTGSRTMESGNKTSLTGSHAHVIEGDTKAAGGSECRPDNYTYRIWKRTT